MAQTKEKKPNQLKLGVRPETYRKYKRIAKQTRRSIAETADVLADEYLSRPSVVTNGDQSPATAT